MKIILRKRKMKKIEAMVIRERVWYTGKRRDRGERSDVFMAKTEKQKLKLLYIMQYLMERTDEDHMVTTQDIIGYLEQYGIHAERKSIYTDIDQLMEFGLDIIRVRERPGGYYLASRQFELAELKLLVDAVQASRFITARKSCDLIRKLESLCSKEQARQLPLPPGKTPGRRHGYQQLPGQDASRDLYGIPKSRIKLWSIQQQVQESF